MQWNVIAQILFLGTITSAYYALLGLSWSIIFATTRTFHFAHGFIYLVGAYGAIFFATLIGLPFAVAFVLAILLAVGIGMLIEWGVYNPLRKVGASSFVIFVSSLGILILGQYVIYILFSPRPMPILGFEVSVVNIGSVRTHTGQTLTLIVSIIGIVFLQIFMTKHRLGKAIRAVASNPDMAEVIGIKRNRIFLLAVGLGSALVAAASIPFNLDKMSIPSMGTYPLFIAFIVAFIGGAGNVTGAVIGGIILGMVEGVSSLWIAQKWSVVVTFSVLVVIIILRPGGILTEGRK